MEQMKVVRTARQRERELGFRLCLPGNSELQLSREWKIGFVSSCADYRRDDGRFWLSFHDCQIPTRTSQKLEVEQQIRILGLEYEELPMSPCLS
jgi:hypothetical protein